MYIQYLQSFVAGLLISLSGSLPLGNLNIAAMQIAIKGTLKKALWFAGGVVLVEMIYLSFTLSVLDRFAISDSILFLFRAASVILLLVMAAGNFMAIKHKKHKNIVLNNKAGGVVLGIAMSAVNPMQVPFWAGWAVYLLSQSLLVNSTAVFTIFVFSAGIGTFTALLLFIFTGRKFSAFMLRNQRKANLLIGGVFVGMAVIQFIKLW